MMTLATSHDAQGSRLYPARPYLAVSTAVVREGRVLVAMRTKPPMQSLFSLPGGMVETGERLEEAALRELAEEVGVTAAIIGPVGHVDVIERDDAGRVKRHVAIVSFAARWISGDGTPGPEAARIAWVDADELAALPVSDGLPAIAGRALALAGHA